MRIALSLLAPAFLACAVSAQGNPPPVQAAPVDPFEAGLIQPLPLEPALLARWGYDVAKVMALSPAQRLDLQRHLTLLEVGRLRKIELLRRIEPEDWKKYLDERELLTPEGERLVEDYLSKLAEKPMAVPARISELARKDGKPLTPEDRARLALTLDRMFDGVAGRDVANLGTDFVVDARVRNETLHSLTLSNPRSGWAVEVGQLYATGRHGNAAPSWYGNLMGGWDSKPDSWVDYRFKVQIGYVDLKARYFANGSGTDPRLGRMLDLGRSLGLSQSDADNMRRYTTYDDPYQTHGLVVSSLLMELGRAYNLYGPLDVVWTAGSLTKLAWAAPNTAFDETLGLRVRLNKDLSFGIFGGAVQNISPVGNRLLQEVSRTDNVKGGVYVENAPHVSAALWGKVPGVSDISFSLRGTERRNELTTAREGELSLMSTFLNRPIALRGTYSRENGEEIGFDRKKARVQLDYQVNERVSAYLAYERDRVKYGNASVDTGDAFLLGFEATLGGGDRSGVSVSVDHMFGGEYRGKTDPMVPHMKEALGRMNREITAGLDIADRADEVYRRLRPELAPSELQGPLNELSLALSRLDAAGAEHLLDRLSAAGLNDDQRQFLADLWTRTISPDSPYRAQLDDLLRRTMAATGDAERLLGRLDRASAWYGAHREDIRELLGLLSDEDVWTAAVIQAGRHALIEAMAKNGDVELKLGSLGDLPLRIDAPAVLAASSILQSRLSPVAPAAAGDMSAFLRRKGLDSLGLDANATDDQIIASYFSRAGDELKRRLAEQLGPLIDRANAGYDPVDLGRRIIAILPPQVAAELQQTYGVNLAGLIPPDLDGEGLKRLLTTTLPDKLVEFLSRRYGPDLARALASATTWAGELLSREINMMLIQMMLASEELNRLTVDKGKKINDLDLRFAMRSFDMLDARKRPRAEARVGLIQQRLARQAVETDARLVDRAKSQARLQLETMQLDPAWPAGLRVEIDDAALAPIVAYYGDGPFFELVGKIKETYLKNPRTGGLNLTFAFDDAPGKPSGMGAMIWRSKGDPNVKIKLPRPRDPRDARFKLKGLETYVED
jgi:hypothetical protein